jgi:tRNA U38,U39,U40 pseudouridine synthase TruA
MVRNIAGVLETIGKGEQSENWAEEVLGLRDRTLGADP